MKSFDQYTSENGQRLDEFLDPLTVSLSVFLGTMFFRSGMFDRFIDKLEEIANRLEKNHFLKQCLEKLKTIPKNPSLEDVKNALGTDFDRFKKEFTDQVAKP